MVMSVTMDTSLGTMGFEVWRVLGMAVWTTLLPHWLDREHVWYCDEAIDSGGCWLEIVETPCLHEIAAAPTCLERIICSDILGL